jgi:hypothetical protein
MTRSLPPRLLFTALVAVLLGWAAPPRHVARPELL